MSSAAPAVDKAPAKRTRLDAIPSRAERLLARFHQIRDFTTALCRNLEPEDFVVQSMPDVSPTKWHLAHTTWFFEIFVLKKFALGYRSEIPQYAYLFNSYYNAAGDMHRRDLRGLISRPTVKEAQRYRSSIDSHIDYLFSDADEKLLDEIEPILILGIHHEQQHQELLVTDIKHVFAQNPLYPVFRERKIDNASPKPTPIRFFDFEETAVEIGHDGSGFSYDNEGPRHRALVPAFSIASRPVTNGEYIAFIEDNGYGRPEFWLSLGWMTVNEQRWQAPLYWVKRDGGWWNFTLSGFRPVAEFEPVTAFVQARHLHQMFGDVWEWTRSAYSPYPGYRAAPGALGEYNGKFMCNQYVLRGGSCASSRSHIRRTYRNFFQPEKRWQFTGIRLARDPQ